MFTPDIQDLKYGFIYVMGNPTQTHNLYWFASMVEPMIRPLSLRWVETMDYDHTLIVARRFNVGNLGKYATVQLHLNRYGHSDTYSLLAALHAFSDCLQDIMDADEGDVIIKEADYSDRNQTPQGKWGNSPTSIPLGDVLRDNDIDEISRSLTQEKEQQLEMERERRPKFQQDHTRVEKPYLHPQELDACPPKSSKRHSEEAKPTIINRFERLRKKLNGTLDIAPEETSSESFESVLHEQFPSPVGASPDTVTFDDDSSINYRSDTTGDGQLELIDLEAEELDEFKRIEAEYERDVRDLRARIVAFIAKYHQDPNQMMTTLLEGKVLLGVNPGRVLVNGDMKIVLPDYDEMEIKMPALCRTLYILFMKQRKMGKGIVLRNIDEFRDEIKDIYSMVKPGASEERAAKSIDNLCVPLSESLNQNISRINSCIKKVITDKELVKQYIITGVRGEEYGIALEPEYLDLPRAVTA